jgi:hypothetical protein
VGVAAAEEAGRPELAQLLSPLGDTAMAVAPPVWPSMRSTILPVRMSQTRIVLSSLAVTMRRPSGE